MALRIGRSGCLLLALFGCGAAGCSRVDEVALADIELADLRVTLYAADGQPDSVFLDVTLTFARPEDETCYELSPDTRVTVGDLVIPHTGLGGITEAKLLYPEHCIDIATFDRRDVPLSTALEDTTIRVEDESGHIEMTVKNLLVQRQLSFIDPPDGIVHNNKLVRLQWTPADDPVTDFGVSFVSPAGDLHSMDRIESHDFRDGTVEFFSSTFFMKPVGEGYLEPGATLEGRIKMDVDLEPTVTSCGIGDRGTCTTSYRVFPETPVTLQQD